MPLILEISFNYKYYTSSASWSPSFAETVKKIRKPKPWKHSDPITRAQLVQMREEFWDTAPHYGGRKGKFLDSFY